MNTQVNLEIAKLLKLKRIFPIDSGMYYNDDNVLSYCQLGSEMAKACKDNNFTCCLAPTISEIVDWFFNKHCITIDTSAEEIGEGESGEGPVFKYFVQDWRNLKRSCGKLEYFRREEAYMEAFKDVLNNYIKIENTQIY